MAIARLSMKVGKAGKASPHAAYIAREGQYASRLDRGERLEETEAGNMPAWAQSNTLAFWQAADAYERKNGTTYREMEIALPRELDAVQRADLVRDWVAQEIGDRHAYQWAIHVPTAADGGEQPHVHLMFSERQRDGIERDPDQYFKRYNAKNPERGGCRKGYGPHAGQKLSKSERVADLKELRARWEAACNAALECAERTERIDMRSYAEQGRDEQPEAKQLPSKWRGEGKTEVIEFRAAKAERKAATAEVAQALPNMRAEIIELKTEKERREVAAMPPALLVAAWDKASDQKAADYRQRADRLAGKIESQIQTIEDRRETTVNEHDKGRPEPPKGMLAGMKQRAYEKATAAWAATRERLLEWKRKREADLKSRLGRIGGYLSRRAQGVPDKAREKAEKVLARTMPAHAARLPEAREQVRKAQAGQRAREQVAAAFRSLATQRQLRANGYSDTGKKWQAMPAKLREAIERFNQTPKAGQQRILETMQKDSKIAKQFGDLIQAGRRSRERDQGISR